MAITKYEIQQNTESVGKAVCVVNDHKNIVIVFYC